MFDMLDVLACLCLHVATTCSTTTSLYQYVAVVAVVADVVLQHYYCYAVFIQQQVSMACCSSHMPT
jgi:hypothetical protein